jgi:Uri superfamily endonuclease
MERNPLHNRLGTYIVIFQNDTRSSIAVGRWGVLIAYPGYYSYIGSAFGPGGVRARVRRHCRTEKPVRWHVDYLSGVMHPFEAWYSYAPFHLEHLWSRSFAAMSGATPIKGFGCSDCNCDTHLYFMAKKPALLKFKSTAGGSVQSCRLHPIP